MHGWQGMLAERYICETAMAYKDDIELFEYEFNCNDLRLIMSSEEKKGSAFSWEINEYRLCLF